MSKIALSPDDSGTGTFTLASPNSNTNRTLTLPDVAGELLTTTGNGSGLTGIVAGTLATTVTLGTWTITDTGGVLTFSSGGSAKFSISAAGAITAADNVIAYGTP